MANHFPFKRPGKVAAVHFFTRRADGVSLQMEENHTVLSQLGWEITEVSADTVKEENGFPIRELDYRLPEVQKLKAGLIPENQADAYFDAQVQKLKLRFEKVLEATKPTVFHVRNILSLPIHPAATVAMSEFIKKHPEMLFVTQHHDFLFEEDFEKGDREKEYALPYPALQERVKKALLPTGKNVRLAVISYFAQNNLYKKYSIKAAVIHDSFDFNKKPYEIQYLKKRLEISDNDIVVGMMTRILPRKGIEVAIRFIAELQKRKNELNGANREIILLLPQEAGLDESYNMAYYKTLLKYAKRLKVKIRYIGNQVVADSAYPNHTDKIPFYSLYSIADIITYPSYQEGFGNQFLEATALRRGVVIGHKYPVFLTDILPAISEDGIVSLGDNNDYKMGADNLVHLKKEVLQKAVDREIYLFQHPDEEKATAEKNYKSLKENFDSQVVGQKLSKLLCKN